MDRNMKLLVIGAGSIGERHVRVFGQLPGIEIAIVEPRADRAEEVAAKYGCLAWYTRFDEVALSQFDAALITSPADSHVSLGLRCAGAGLPLLIEKPIAVNPDEVPPLLELCERKGLTLSVAYVLRCHPVVERIRELVKGAVLGRLISADAVAAHQLPQARPDYAVTYFADASKGGGVILDLSHEVNYLEWLVGPLRCVSTHATVVPELGVPTEAVASVLLETGDGAPVRVHLHSCDWMGRRECTLTGTQATIFGDLANGEVCIYGPGGLLEQIELPSERDSWFLTQARDFLSSAPRCTGSEGLTTLRTCTEALRVR
jgi:predicted dehydrogenase